MGALTEEAAEPTLAAALPPLYAALAELPRARGMLTLRLSVNPRGAVEKVAWWGVNREGEAGVQGLHDIRFRVRDRRRRGGACGVEGGQYGVFGTTYWRDSDSYASD